MVNMRMDTPPLVRGKSENVDDSLLKSDSNTLPEPGTEMTNLQRLAVCRLSNTHVSPRSGVEQEKRVRREIANSNERRRMQSINTGFQSLRALLPKRDGEKMSKASILQQTADFIEALQDEKYDLEQQNQQYKEMLESRGEVPVTTQQMSPPLVKRHTDIIAPPKKRRKYINAENVNAESSDEGMGLSETEMLKPIPSASPTTTLSVSVAETPLGQNLQQQTRPAPWEMDILHSNLNQMQLALDRERRIRLLLEDQLRTNALSNLQLQNLGRITNVPSILDYPVASVGLGATILPTPTSYPSLHTSLHNPLNTSSLQQSLQHPPQPLTTLDPKMMTDDMFGLTPIAPTTTYTTLGAVPHSLKHAVDSLVSARQQPNASVAIPGTLGGPGSVGSVMGSNGSVGITIGQQTTATTACGTPPIHMYSAVPPGGSCSSNLEAIVEAIRHLEGDQLFVDTATGGLGPRSLPPGGGLGCRGPIGTVGLGVGSLGLGLSQILEQQRSDSGISSPASEKIINDPFPSHSATLSISSLHHRSPIIVSMHG